MIDEQNPVQMIDLMLEHYGQQPLSGNFPGFPFPVQALDQHLGMTPDLGGKVGYRQAAFLIDDLPFPGDDAGIKHHLEFPGPALFVRDVEHDETLKFTHRLAASPSPGAAYMVSAISMMRRCNFPLISVISRASCRSTGSGNLQIDNTAMGVKMFAKN